VKSLFPSIDPDFALIHGFANLLPPGLLGLSMVLLFGAIMSTLDSGLFTISSAIILDFFKWPKKKAVKGIRVVIAVVSIIALIIGLLIEDLVLGSYIFVALIMIVAVGVIATWIKPSIKQGTLIIGFLTGLIASVVYLVFNLLQGSIEPLIVIVALASSILGIFLGGIYSFVRRLGKGS